MRKLTLAALAVLGTLALAGCLATDDPVEPGATNGTDAVEEPPEEPRVALEECSPCFEPSAAWTGEGELLVTQSRPFEIQNLSRSDDVGHSFETVEPPPVPAGMTRSADVLLQTGPEGRLWWSALRQTEDVGTTIQVARSDDGARSWATDTVVEMGLAGEPTGASEDSDRQWLLFGPDGDVHLVCQCPTGVTQIATSTDDGASWSQPSPVPSLGQPPGKPAMTPSGAIVVPYFTGVGGVSLSEEGFSPRPLGVFASVSQDGGESWDIVPVWTDPGRVEQDGRLWTGFPTATARDDGTVHVGWTAGRQALVATSTDGGASWGDPITWSDEDTRPHPGWSVGRPSHVWLEPLDRDTVLGVWYAGNGDEATVELAWGDETGVEDRRTLAVGQARTDHPHATLGPQGLLAVPFVDAVGNVATRVLEAPGSQPGGTGDIET